MATFTVRPLAADMALGGGTVFKISPAGAVTTTLYSFCSQPNCSDGVDAAAGLVQASDGKFYGVTVGGGTNGGCGWFASCGTIFKITPSGVLTTLNDFTASEVQVCGPVWYRPLAGPFMAHRRVLPTAGKAGEGVQDSRE